MKRSIVKVLITAMLLFVCGGTAHAAMGNIATNYGILPTDIASAQGLSLFNAQASAAYYNPANLAKEQRGQFTSGLFYADHSLEIESKGGSNPPAREGDIINDTPSETVLLGMKTDLSKLTKLKHPICFGFLAGVEKYGLEMLAFESETSRDGQYFRYDRNPLFIRVAGGTQIWRGIDAGVGLAIELHNKANLIAQTDLAGNTEYESLSVNTEPDLQGIFGLSIDLQETFCSGDCLFKGLEMAFSYRMASYSKTSVEANTIIPGTIPTPGLSLAVTTIDSYNPTTIAAGIVWDNGTLRIGLSVEQQGWSDLKDEFADDTIKDQAEWDFQDVIIPRAGIAYKVTEKYTLISGVALEESAIKDTPSLNVNYLDTDRWIAGLGVSARIDDPPMLAFPLQIDIGYQYQLLKDRDFELIHTQAPSNPYETITANGQVHVLTCAITLTL